MTMKTRKIKIGIATPEQQRKRLMAIAKGEYTPKRGEPKIWFSSIESVSQVLSTKNQELLRLIIEMQPQSISELAAETKRDQGNLSRTLKTFEKYGLLRMKKRGKAVVPETLATDFEVDFGLMPSIA